MVTERKGKKKKVYRGLVVDLISIARYGLT